MDNLTVTELVAEVASNLGETGTTTAGSTKGDRIVTWLNWAQKLIVRKVRFSYMLRTDSSLILEEDKFKYSMPPQIQRMLNARLIDNTCVVLSNCESGWADAGAGLTTTHDSTYRHEGSKSVKIVSVDDPTGQISYSADKSPVVDLSGITSGALGFWAYSTTALSAGDIQIVISEATAGAETGTVRTNYITCNVPATDAYKWTYHKVTKDSETISKDLDFSSIDACKSIGIKYADNVAGTLYIDAINLYSQSYGGSNYPLRITTPKILDKIVPNPEYSSTGRPSVLMVTGNDRVRSFECYQVPDDNYPVWIRYYAWPANLDYTNNAGAFSELVDMDDLLIAMATTTGFENVRNRKSAGTYEARSIKLLKAIEIDDDGMDGWDPTMSGASGMSMLYGDLEVPANTQTGDRDSAAGFFYGCY